MNCTINRNSKGKITSVKAPNGKNSILYQSIKDSLPDKIEIDSYVKELYRSGQIQSLDKDEVALALWSKVYTPTFKQWFGDWQKDPKNASKVVDENGEPKLVFHATSTGGFETFRNDDRGIYFHDNKHYVKDLRYDGYSDSNQTYPVFLSIKNPKYRDGIVGVRVKEEFNKNSQIDGVIGKDVGQTSYGVTSAVKEPNQIKSVFNEGEFSLSDNIYYQLTNEESTQVNPQLEKELIKILTALDVDIKLVDKITSKDGQAMNAFGKADLLLGVIELTKNRNVTTLPEEAAHMITALLGMNHPLIKQMMNKIPEMNIYHEVKRDYGDIYNSEEAIRFEAVGKVIAHNIINGHKSVIPANESFINDWFNRVIRILKRLFNNVDTAPLTSEMDVFMKIANDIRSGKIIEEVKKGSEYQSKVALRNISEKYNIDGSGYLSSTANADDVTSDLNSAGLSDITIESNPNGRLSLSNRDGRITTFYQTSKRTQSEIDSQLNSDSSKLSGAKVIDEKGRERYQDEGRLVKDRVTDEQTKVFEKGKTKAEIDAINNSPKSVIGREVGTDLHDINQGLMNHLISISESKNIRLANSNVDTKLPTKKDYMTDSQFTEMARTVKRLLDEIEIQQFKIDPDGKATIHTESIVIDRNRDIAGSMDVLVTYSDASGSIYDYKFINFNKVKIGNNWVISEDTQIPFTKEKSYDLQISEYKKILKEVYGIEKIRASRILPFSIEYARDENNIPIKKIKNLEGFNNDSTKQYLTALPVSKEQTDNNSLNNILGKLFNRHEKLVKEIKDNYQNESKRDILMTEASGVKKAIKAIQLNADLKPLIESIDGTLDVIGRGLSDININNIGELKKMILEIELFKQLYDQAIPILSKEERETGNISTRLTLASKILSDKLEELLIDKFGKDVAEPQKELGSMKRIFSMMSQINHPIFEAAWDQIKKATGDTNRDVLRFVDELTVKVNELKKEGDLLTSYRRITTKEGNLIPLFDKKFHEKIKSSRESLDAKWFKENYKLKDSAKKMYEEDLAQFMKSQRNIGENLREQQLKIWKAKNDLSNDSAWTNKWTLYRYTDLKNPEKFYSEEYKSLPKALKEYYDFLVESNKMFDQLVDDKIKGNFIANIQKDMIDSLAQGGNVFTALKTAKEDFLNGMRVRQHDSYMTVGEDAQKIPLLYLDNFMYKDKNGNWTNDPTKKNEDLTNNVILFAEAVYRKHHMTKIKDIIESLKLQINNQQVYKTDNFGNKKADPNNPGEFLKEDSAENSKLYDTLVTALVYGKRIQSKDTYITIGDSTYSTNKLLSNIMNYMSTKSLAFNYVSGFGNFAGAYTNSYIKGVGGKYYTNKQMWKTHKMAFSRSDRDIYNHLTEYFNVEKDFWVKEKAANLSLSLLTKNLRADRWFFLQQKGDEFVSNTILVSMTQNYGIDENGQVKRLALLPEGTKSLYDRVSRVNDKLEIEGLTDEAFDQFRNMVKYVARQVKGTNTSEDLSMIQTTIGGKAVMHFRNWVAPMVKERFGSLEYTKDVQEFEYGRFRSFFDSLVTDRFLPQFGKLMLDIITLGKVKYKGNTEAIKKQWEAYLKENPKLDPKNGGKLTIEEYSDLIERGIRETIHELKIQASLIIIGMAAAGDWDDDGIADYKQTFITRQVYKMMHRAYLELSFFTTPTSVRDILQAPIPILQVGIDITDLMGNSWDQVSDDIFGQDNNKDKTGRFHYTKKIIPIAKPFFDILEDFNIEE